jgi:hypothetical protein
LSVNDVFQWLIASLGTDAGWDAVRELARVVTERAANAEWGLLEAVVGEDTADRIREAGNLGQTLSLG